MYEWVADDGRRGLNVTMTRDGKAIQEIGPDDQYLWNRLCHKVWAIEKAEAAAPKPAVTFVRTPRFRMHQVVRLTTSNWNHTGLRKGSYGSVISTTDPDNYRVRFRRKKYLDCVVLHLKEDQIKSIPLH